MLIEKSVFLTFVLLGGVAGCSLFQAMTFDRAAVGRALPPNVRLDMVVRPSLDRDDTVERELIRIGAHVDGSGKLLDSAGKEIHFTHQPRPIGVHWPEHPLTAEDLRKRAEWEKFRQDFTVIEITWNQRFEPEPS